MITYDWWSNGFIPKNYNLPVTHQTARLTMTNNRIFGRNADSSDVWDLRDSVLELCEHEQRQEITYRSNSGLPSTVDFRDSYNEENILHWLSEDPGNGFIRIYPPDTNEFLRSCLIPCNLKTSVQQICRKLGIGAKVLHLQMNGDVIRRLEPQELPLSIQNDFLVSLGYTDIIRMQEEGPKEDLAYLIKFYSGKPICDNGPISNPIQGYVLVKKGGMFQHWTTRWCAIYNTRLHFYRDNNKKDMPTIFQLTGGSVERTEGKGAEFCLKIASRDNDKQIFLNFSDENDCLDWFKKCKKATDRLPTTADLSCCHLEYLPENVFVNKDLMVLNLQHNLLKDRPCDEDTILGWIDDFDKFSYLRSINLADNNLQQFPLAVCKITTLVELNLASNKIKEIPPNVKFLENLQAFHMHNNHLTNLPDEIISLKKLSFIILAFNRFADIPTVVAQLTNIRFSETEGVLMSGNQIERIATDVLMELKHARKLDLRLNLLTLPLTETMKFSVLEHLSHLDVRDNQISELDLRSVKTLTILHCERNGMTSLSLHGGSLKVLLSSCNCLDQLVIFPKPEGLIHIDISDNCLEYLPDWLSDCHQLKKLIAHENFLRELPPRLFLNAKKLNHVNLAHNHLTNLPSEIGGLSLESLQIQHNYIFALPQNLLMKLTRLTVFNSSRSLLQSFPRLNDNTDLNRLQELHLSGNFLGNEVMKTITGYTRLKTLNLAHNEISELYDEDILKMVMLQELNVSSNQLQMLPESLGHLQNLVVLRAHSNYLTSLPNFCNAKSLRILDVGHNKLLNISVTDLMASKLNLLDIGLNEHLKVDRQEFRSVISKKNICLVDSSGQNRKVPGLTRKRFTNNLETEDPSVCPWKVGFSESSGSRNKLCIQIVKFLDFNNNDCLVGIFDGGRNSELPKLLAKNIKRIFNEEINHPTTREKFMKYAFLSAHKNLKLTGQKIGVSAALCHIHKTLVVGTSNGNKPHGQMFNFVLSIANVGDVEAVLCRKGEAVLLTRKFVALSDNEETQRVCKSSGIVTEDGKVNGVTPCTRLLGCAHLYPHVIPEPFYISLSLQTDDEFVIVANHLFWKYVPYEEAVEEAYNIGNPIVASKHLQDLAECYGSKENIAVLVLRLNTEPGPSLGRLKPPCREMSIDDVEAAIQHDLEIAQRRSTQKRLIGGQHFKQLSFVKNNRPFLQRTMFPLDKSLINNDVVTSSNNNQKSEALKTSSSANDAKVQDDKSPSQAKVVTFEPRDLNSSNSTGSQTSHTSSVGSSNKAAKFSYNELNSSTTTSHGSSIEGSISFTHNGTHLTPTKHDGGSVPGESSSSSSRDNNNSLSPHNQQIPLQRSQGFKNKFPPPRPLVGKSENSAPVKLEISSPNSTEVEAGNQQNSNEVLEKVEEFKLPQETGKGFSNNLRVDGVPHDRRTSKITIPASPPSRPQSRFIKRSSALEALNAANYSHPQANMYRSSDSLLCDSLSQLDPLGHLNKISTAKEKKLSMYLMPSKMEPSSHGVTHFTKPPSPTSQEVPVITRNKVSSLLVVPEVVQNSPRQNNFSSSDVKDSEIIEIMSHKSMSRAPPQTKRGSIMNTIAMFESANASKPPIYPSSRIIIDKADDRTNRTQETDAKKLQQSPVLENSPNGALNPIKYQIQSTTRPLEIPKNIEKINRPSTIIRPSYSPNVGSLPKSCFDFNKEPSSNNDKVRNNQERQIEAYEIAKF